MAVVEAEIEQMEQHEEEKNQLLGRQSSIYSLTLDEFQHALNESGKNFGSMNMDEFLTSIWNAEETHACVPPAAGTNTTANNLREPLNIKDNTSTSLARQASLTIPAPLCRKTVDEVWSEIHGGRQHQQQGQSSTQSASATRQPTFGEMTLEDFLVKAGVVREQHAAGVPTLPLTQLPQFGLYHSGSNQGLVSKPFNIGGSGGYPQLGYAEDGKKTAGGYSGGELAGPSGVCNNYKAAVQQGQGMGMGGHPMSPVTSDQGGQAENSDCQYGMEMVGSFRGRKRTVDGPVEKVVERRQRRMIKNRESAARSRARKQAYTVELEAELNQLKEENSQLRQALAELERRRKQQLFEELKISKAQTKEQRAREQLNKLRRVMSCPF